MADSEPKIYVSEEQFAWLKSLEVSKGKELLARIEEQTEILKAQEARYSEALRDTFATNALIGIGTWMPMPDSGIPSLVTDASLKARAEWAYRQADAMIAARGTK